MDKSRRSLIVGMGAGMGALLYAGLAGAAAGKTKAREKVIKVEAKKFVYTPSRIVLKKNQAVVLEITALDFAHGFKIPDWNIRADLIPGQVVKVRLKPDTAGEFDFLCDNFCGSGHEEMSGKIVVQG
ncbi:MAG TPA: cupredoxin domain-containing protein [Burkholderiaceae bacterium]|jgi:cytochrome c oxidase subunit 2